MNQIDRLLLDEMHRLVDRVATLEPDGLVDALAAHPHLRSLIDAAEARLTAVRADLVGLYRQWEEAIEEYEDLWALCALKRAAPERGIERRAA
jgi:hypothetical protein